MESHDTMESPAVRPGDDQLPARLIISRNLPIDVGRRQVILSLDGKPLATLLFNQSASREIASGHHSLRAYNTLVWKTVEFDAAPGEEVRFVTANRAGKLGFAMLTVIGVGPMYLTLERA